MALLQRGALFVTESTLRDNESLADELGLDLAAHLLGCVAPARYVVVS